MKGESNEVFKHHFPSYDGVSVQIQYSQSIFTGNLGPIFLFYTYQKPPTTHFCGYDEKIVRVPTNMYLQDDYASNQVIQLQNIWLLLSSFCRM